MASDGDGGRPHAEFALLAPSSEGVPSGGTVRRLVRRRPQGTDVWEISVADNEVLIIVQPADGARTFETETCKSEAAAKRRADALVNAKLADGFGDPEDAGPASRPPPPSFDGRKHITKGGAVLTLSDEGEGGASEAAFRAVLQEIKRAGSTSIELEAEDYLPQELWMKAMATVQLPAVESFSFEGCEFQGPDLGDLTSLFEACPNLVSLDLQGGGALRPVTAPRLESMRIWDWSLSEDETGEALARSSFPELRELSISTRTGGEMTTEQVRRLLERAAPRLQTLHLSEFLDQGAFEGVLMARAPALSTVSVRDDALQDYLELIREHGMPSGWKDLVLGGAEEAEAEDTFAFFEAHASLFSTLRSLELDFRFDDDGALERLGGLCPCLAVE